MRPFNSGSGLYALMLALALYFASYTTIEAQSCVTNSRNSWEWPGHNNWFIGTFSGASNVTGKMIDFKAGFTKSTTGQAVLDKGTPVYEGITSASNDQGELVVFSNGRWAWDANSVRTSTDIKEGNEGGFNIVGSAAQGIMALRHPLVPNKYYIVTTGDVIGAYGPPVSYNIFDEQGQEIQGNTLMPGGIRSCEGISATFHANGVDIWVTVLEAQSANYHSWLLTCDGFVSASVVTSIGNPVSSDAARGGIAFSHDGRKLASIFGGNGKVRNIIYDFDNKTGKFSNRKDIGIVLGYDVVWTKDNSKLVVGGLGLGNFLVDATTGNSTLISGPDGWHHAVEIGADGNYYLNGKDGLWRWSGSGAATKVDNTSGQGLPSIYIPPAEEPDIQEIAPLCDTSDVVDLHTYWLCSGISAEDTLYNRHSYYLLDPSDPTGATHAANSAAVIGEKTGVFNPKVAGEGTHKIVFEYCAVNDTIEILVNKCQNCIDTLKTLRPQLCAGNTYGLKALIDTANGPGIWTIDSLPGNSGSDAQIDDSTLDTLFDASANDTKPGIYKLKYTVTKDGQTCEDSAYIRVDANPIVTVNNDTICMGDPPATFTPTSDSTASVYLWSGNASGSASTASGSDPGDYTVSLTDANGCQGSGTGTLIVNALPVVSVNSDTICEGDPAVTFTATVDSTVAAYQWGDNGTGTSSTTTGNTAGTYSVSITDENGCKGDASGTLLVNALPVIQVNSDTICIGDPDATFTASSDSTAASYLWADNGTGSNATTAGSTAGTYSVTVTDKNGCVGQGSGSLKVNALPVVTVNDEVICQGDPAATFTASSDSTAATYAWYENGSGNTSSVTGTIAGNYSVEVTDENGCVGTGTGTLRINALPVITIADQVICEGDPAATFTANSDSTVATYLWSDNGTGSSSTTTGTTAGNYTVTVTDVNNCLGSQTASLTVNAKPTPSIPDAAICPGMSQTIDATYAGTTAPYTYAWDSGQNTASINVTPNSTTSYTVTVTDGNGCVGTAQATITIQQNLTVNIAGAPSISLCEGDDATLISNYKTADGYNFQWSNGSSATTESIVVSTSGTYDLHVDNGLGCEGDGTVKVIVNPIPQPDNDPGSICSGQSTTIGKNMGPGYTYLWDGTNITTFSLAVTTGGSYIRTVTSAAGCSASSTFVVDEFQNPSVDLGPDITVCEQVPVTLSERSGSVVSSYSWSTGESTATISPTTSGTYSLSVVDANNCPGQGQVVVTFRPIPSVSIPDTLTVCEGESKAVDAGNPGIISWSTGSTDSEIVINSQGSYVAIANNGTCADTGVVYLEVVEFPTSMLDKRLEDQLFCFEEMDSAIVLTAGTNERFDYLWDSGETSSTLEVTEEGTHYVSISLGTCSIDDEITLTEYCPYSIFVPNAFTPNGDGRNDIFYGYGTNLIEYQLVIFDRWGLRVFDTNDIHQGWDGTYRGADAPNDVYVWKVYYRAEEVQGTEKNHEKVGTVTLVR